MLVARITEPSGQVCVAGAGGGGGGMGIGGGSGASEAAKLYTKLSNRLFDTNRLLSSNKAPPPVQMSGPAQTAGLLKANVCIPSSLPA